MYILADDETKTVKLYRSIHDAAGQFTEVEAVTIPSPAPDAQAEKWNAEFAVVAGEVNNLSLATGRATEDVSGQVNGVQGGIASVASAIMAIADENGGLDQIAGKVSDAMGEQRRTAHADRA